MATMLDDNLTDDAPVTDTLIDAFSTLGDGRTAPVPAEVNRAFLDDVFSGFARSQKSVPARWFYDHRGSGLFEAITKVPEYYPTRAEVEILESAGDEIGLLIGPGRAVIEFGAGSAAKTPLLLDRIAPSAYVPIDISGEFLRESCAVLQTRYPTLPIIPVAGDFTNPVIIPSGLEGRALLGFFPGSTIGNLEPASAVDLLRALRATLSSDRDSVAMLLIGMDRIKDPAVLEAAYDDSAGVTAAFNRNLAMRINRELSGTIPVDALRHQARWNDGHARVEMHLAATRDIEFTIHGRAFVMRAGETIQTEDSHKYDERSAATLLRAGGWDPRAWFSDSASRYMVVLADAMDIAAG